MGIHSFVVASNQPGGVRRKAIEAGEILKMFIRQRRAVVLPEKEVPLGPFIHEVFRIHTRGGYSLGNPHIS
jgi:hypothetical protein